jgi:hypothetical protein
MDDIYLDRMNKSHYKWNISNRKSYGILYSYLNKSININNIAYGRLCNNYNNYDNNS